MVSLMNAEHLAFFNLQLAGMIKSGLPLEGALRQLAATMQQGGLRDEMEELRRDLESGTPLEQALSRRALPPVYVQMLRLGARGGNLAGVLTWVADYYRQTHNLAARLKGMLVYPVLVWAGAFALSLGFAALVLILQRELLDVNLWTLSERSGASIVHFGFAFFPPIALALAGALAFLATLHPDWRSSLRWRLPGFKDVALARLGASLSILLRGGLSLRDAVSFLQEIETDRRLAGELAGWQRRLADGESRIQNVIAPRGLVPPLFGWVVANAGDDLARGFNDAAELYQSRAVYRNELVLYAALPVSVLLLGFMICGQMYGMLKLFTSLFMFDSGLGL